MTKAITAPAGECSTVASAIGAIVAIGAAIASAAASLAISTRAFSTGATAISSGASSPDTVSQAKLPATWLATSTLAQSCFSRQWYRYGLGHDTGTADTCTIKSMSKLMTQPNGFKQALQLLVQTDAFTMRRSP